MALTLTKAELADLMFDKVGLNKREAKDMVESFFEEIRTALATPFEHAPDVKTFGGNNRYKITTAYLINESTAEAELKIANQMYTGLQKFFPNTSLEEFKKKIITSQKVGPTIADDVRQSALWSVLFGCALMFLYILVRFRKWQYGLGATVALLHDVLVVLSF